MWSRWQLIPALVLAASCGLDEPAWTPVPVPYCAVDEAKVDATYGSLSQGERIGQHLMVGVEADGKGNPSPKTVVKLTGANLGGVFVQPATGIVLGDPLATATFVHQVKKAGFEHTGVPLFVSLDQEGGPNAAVNSMTGGTDTIGSMPIGATGDPQVAFEEFDIMGREVRDLGMNMDLGPVVDTLYSTRNGNLNTRSFGPDPDMNAELGIAAVNGLQHNLVIAVAKHFPGDGLTDGNTHVSNVFVQGDRELLEATILKPFGAVVSHGVDGIMTIPAAYPAFDPKRSAITSRAITTDLLRGDMGFDGIVVTDALGMKGVDTGLEPGQSRGVEALKAGADVLLYVTASLEELEEVRLEVEAAIDDGSYPASEFEESTKRIIRTKMKYCLFESPDYPSEDLLATLSDRLALDRDAAAARVHADRAAVLLHDDGVLPLTGKKVLYVGPDTVFQDPGSGWLNVVDQTFGDAMAAHDPSVQQVTYFMPMDPNQQFAAVSDMAKDVDVVVVGTLQGRFSIEQQQLLEWILSSIDLPVVHVILGVPFDYAQSRGRAAAVVALMGSRSPMTNAGAAVLYGQQVAAGRMLFDLDALAAQSGFSGPKEPSSTPDRCVTQGVTCSGSGICVDYGAGFGCVCHPNWHASPDGMDCVPDGKDS